MRLFSPNDADLDAIASLLASGEVVALPTETVYGLAANALNPEAVAKIFDIKNRPATNPLIVHTGSGQDYSKWVEIPEIAQRLIEAFWPGPLTLVLPRKSPIPDCVTAGLPTVGIRMPAHPLMRALLDRIPFPLAAPSANPSNYISPTCAAHVKDGLEGKLQYLMDGGECNLGIESTIVSLHKPDDPLLLRPGPIPPEAIEKVMGCPLRIRQHFSRSEGPMDSPGQMKVHYSPRTPLILVDPSDETPASCARIRIKPEAAQNPAMVANPSVRHFFLSVSGDPGECARHLYKILHLADQSGADSILIDRPPDKPEWLGLADRIRRAAASGSTPH